MIYERLKEGKMERKVKYKEAARERKRIKADIHILGTHMPSPLLPLSSSSSFICLTTGCILSPCLVYFKFISFFSSVICQKTSLLDHFQTHSLCVSQFLTAFPSMSLNHRHCQKSLNLLSHIHTVQYL